ARAPRRGPPAAPVGAAAGPVDPRRELGEAPAPPLEIERLARAPARRRALRERAERLLGKPVAHRRFRKRVARFARMRPADDETLTRTVRGPTHDRLRASGSVRRGCRRDAWHRRGSCRWRGPRG